MRSAPMIGVPLALWALVLGALVWRETSIDWVGLWAELGETQELAYLALVRAHTRRCQLLVAGALGSLLALLPLARWVGLQGRAFWLTLVVYLGLAATTTALLWKDALGVDV